MLHKRTIKQLALPPITTNFWSFNKYILLLTCLPQRFLNNKQLEMSTIKLYQDYSSRLTQKKKNTNLISQMSKKGRQQLDTEKFTMRKY